MLILYINFIVLILSVCLASEWTQWLDILLGSSPFSFVTSIITQPTPIVNKYFCILGIVFANII